MPAVAPVSALDRFGYCPPPLDRSADAGKDITLQLPENRAAALASYIAPGEDLSFGVSDSSFDLRGQSKLTAIRDQGDYGTCWAFASLASLESNLLPAETWDFSENGVAMNSGFFTDSTDLMNYGGNTFMSSAYLLRWAGPVNETDDPYDGVRRTGKPVRKHMQETLWLPAKTSQAYSATYINNVKAAIVSYGAVAASIYWDGAAAVSIPAKPYYYFYNSHCTISNGSRNCQAQSSRAGGHLIALVGWVDNLDRTSFTTSANGTPAGDGAWLARNSWGSEIGDGGYFYISYYDTSHGCETAVFHTAEETSNYTRQYGYDTLGWTNSIGSGLTGWMAMQAVSAEAGETIKSVGFYNTESGAAQYNIYIYTGSAAGAPRSGTLAYSAAGTLALSGYHTIPLATPVTLRNAGTRFSAVVRLANQSYVYPIPIEYNDGFYSAKANASANETFYSDDGGSWTDLTEMYAKTSACLKAYTSASQAGGIDTSTIVVKGYPSPCDFKKNATMTLGGLLTGQTNVKIRVYSLSGQLVRTFDRIDGLTPANQALWDGKNQAGERVASGVYIVLFTADAMNPKTEKVAVFW